MMEAEYGVGVKNRFAFLGNDCDADEECAEISVTIKLNKSSTSGAGKKSAVSKSVVGVNKSPNNKTTATVSAGSNRVGGSKETVSGGRNQSTNKVQEEKRTRDIDGGPPTRQGQGSGTQGFRRDREPRERPSNKRNFNRSRFTEEKDKEDNQDKKDSTEIAGENTVVDGDGKDVEEINEAAEGDVEKTDGDDAQEDENAKEEKTLTLAEWKALQAPREKPVFNIRKPGEGESSAKLEKLVLKKREDDIGGQEDEEYEADDVYYPQRAGKMKLIKDVGFNTGYQKRRGGRFGPSTRVGGGDGNGREANSATEQTNVADKPRFRPRFAYRGGQQRPAQVPRIDDASDFPTLG